MDKSRLQELAGIQLNESGHTRLVAANIADEMIKKATDMVKPAQRSDNRKVQEYIDEIMRDVHARLADKGFSVDRINEAAQVSPKRVKVQLERQITNLVDKLHSHYMKYEGMDDLEATEAVGEFLEDLAQHG